MRVIRTDLAGSEHTADFAGEVAITRRRGNGVRS